MIASDVCEQAIAAERRGDLDQAERWYRQAAEWFARAAERGNAGAMYNLGFIREDQGDHDAARELWERAVERGHPHAASRLGVLHLRQQRHDAGVVWLRRAVEEFDDRAATATLAGFYAHVGDTDRARFWRELPTGLRAYSQQFEAFAADVAAAAIHRQWVLDKALGDGDVRYDLDARTWATGGRVLHGLTSLGSFSRLDRSWLWTWHNDGFGADHPTVAPLLALRDHGREHDIPELTVGRLELGGFPDPEQAATTLAILAASVLGGNGVRACAINGGDGMSYFHLDDPQLPVATFDVATAADAVLNAIAVFPADPKRVVRGFISHYGEGILIGPDTIVGRFAGGHRLKAAFTPEGAVTVVSAESAAG